MRATHKPRALSEPKWVRYSLIGLVLAFLILMLVIPLISIFVEALAKGFDLYIAALTEPDALAAIKLTLLTAAIVVPINAVIGIAIAWLLTRYDFRGKQFFYHFIRFTFCSLSCGGRFNVCFDVWR